MPVPIHIEPGISRAVNAHSMPVAVRVFRSHTEATKWLGGEEV